MRRTFLLLCAVVPAAGSFVTGPASAAGLLAPTDQNLPPLRITDHSVDIEVQDRIALTEVTQTFHNDTRRRLEATYVFPLPEQADLTDFRMSFNGKMVKGEVLPAKEARRIYEDIVRRTKDPGLIEFIGRRLLRMRVFPIEPGSDTTIKLRYQQITRPISGMHGYHYPLRTRKTTGQAYGMVRFNARIKTKTPLKNIWSPSHSVEIVRNGEHQATIGYEASGGSLEEDFVLLYDTDDSDLGLSVVAYHPEASNKGHFVLMLTPKQLWPKAEQQAQDVVFVVDTSGSMSGEKIEQARRALQFCVDQLDEKDRFSVVRFSTGFDVLFEDLMPATRDRRAEAHRFADAFAAGGGTNIADTLAQVMSMMPRKGDDGEAGRPFVVVFMTDGKGNRQPPQIMEAIKSRAKEGRSVRVFPFGVGHDVNTLLLDMLANEFTGRPTYVQPGENLELVMGDFFAVVSQPVLTNLRLKLPDIGATERFPATLGDLYHGQQLIVAGQFDKARTGTVTLVADRNGRQVDFSWSNIAFTNAAEATYVPAVWAGRKIAYLIDQIRAHGENDEMIAEVIELSRQHGIQTPYSSWLVTPEGRPMLGRPVIIRQRERLQGFFLRDDSSGAAGRDARTPDASRVDELYSAESVLRQEGKAANIIARRNAALRGAGNRDGARLDDSVLAVRVLGGRRYNSVGEYLVDEAVDESTKIDVIRFGSEAYFELVTARKDLRAALAARTHVVVMVSATRAVLISDVEGTETLDKQQREQLRLPVDP